MDTIIRKLTDSPEDEDIYQQAAQIICRGGLVAFPTETVYGLGADGMSEDAARKIYAAKGRPTDNPLILHIADRKDLERITDKVTEDADKLMTCFWPGPLTLIFEKRKEVPYGITGGLETVAVRMPSDPAAAELIRLSGVPVAAPSANLSGRPSPTRAEHVRQDLDGRIDLILDGGPVGIGLESTIVDVTEEIPVLLRPGAITMEMLRELLGEVRIDPAILGPVGADARPRAPGMKYRHYAPRAEMTLVEGGSAAVARRIRELVDERQKQGYTVGVICTDETKESYPRGLVRSIGARSDERSVAHNLYALLREFDDLGADYIYSEKFSDERLGQAIMNRLNKAAGYRVLKV